ncbi:MAG: 50S ribosomal protein L22 [Bacteroidetes bacterium]|jgi:large subunit ribosomal protein L22|nr:50S ribosomal protein L22 [Bacteroidota bacterium]MDA0942693.1 50S ribosomal protein L22 [Bacteroidota bacterium]MDA1111347.1 50S ribosomal protein L22 [Bacteroidota bacterium]
MEAKAILRNCPLSPRKMRLVADMVRGQRVEKALNILQWNPKPTYAIYLSKLIKSGIANWGQMNGDERIEDSELYVKTIMVDGGLAMKRLRTAPQGRGYRQKKRSNHVTIVIDSLKNSKNESEA